MRGLGVEDRMGQVMRFVTAPEKLNRHHADIYALHAHCLAGLDRGKAQRLLDLAAELVARRPAKLVSDRYEG